MGKRNSIKPSLTWSLRIVSGDVAGREDSSPNAKLFDGALKPVIAGGNRKIVAHVKDCRWNESSDGAGCDGDQFSILIETAPIAWSNRQHKVHVRLVIKRGQGSAALKWPRCMVSKNQYVAACVSTDI